MNAQKRGLLTRLLLAGAGVFLSQAPLLAQAQDKPVSGGTLNVIVQPEPPALMLGLNQLGPTQFPAGKIYQSLLAYSPDLKPMPSLAQSLTVSED